MEENRRLAIERKRKSMQVLSTESNDKPAANVQAAETSSKRQKTLEHDHVEKNVCKVMDAQGQSADEEDEDEQMNAMDIAEFMD